MTTDAPERDLDILIRWIAHEHLSISTLQARGRDSLDFHDVHVDEIRGALHAAFQLGQSNGLNAVKGHDDLL
jgi:hypothetical protein